MLRLSTFSVCSIDFVCVRVCVDIAGIEMGVLYTKRALLIIMLCADR